MEKRKSKISRREFLRGAGATAAGLVLGGCCPEAIVETLVPTPTIDPTIAPTPVPTGVPLAAPTSLPTGVPSASPTAVPTVVPTATPQPTLDVRPRVGIARAGSYDRALVRQQVEALLDSIGGLGDVVRPGARVAIKPNLTGGTAFDGQLGVPATESYVTHPEVVRALGELLRDAGAGEITIVEAVYEWDSYRQWGYEEIAGALGAGLLDLNAPAPYADFATVPVGAGWFVYESFVFNRILQEVDTFISVSKMKCHCNAGITHTIKNLVGLVPAVHYRLSDEHNHRSAMHGTAEESRTRLPRVIVDLARARPIHLALIDGIKTVEGGEGPWNGGLTPVEPGVLLAGKNGLATDAVATAVMGFDPVVEYPTQPFAHGDNHLNLARGLGLGTNRLGEIAVTGAALDEVRYMFRPC